MKNSIKEIRKKKNSISYKDSGVDIDAGNELVERIKPFARLTSRTGSDTELGGFGALFDLAKCNFKDPILVSSTDGVGTKVKIAQELDIHHTIGIDLVAMCVNDIIVQGAEPLFFLDYFASSKLSVDQASAVIQGIAHGCKLANCALIGGETAEMPGIYQKGEYDLAGFCVGAAERDAILPKQNVKEGDIILGLRSSGIHSNGFSLIRHILKEKNIGLDYKLSGIEIGELLLEPTRIYVKSCLETIRTGKIKALSHITGGGLVENIPRVLPKNLQANIDFTSFELPELFSFFKEAGNVTDKEMYRTFNCGIGMVLICDKEDLEDVKKSLRESGEEPLIIGHISKK